MGRKKKFNLDDLIKSLVVRINEDGSSIKLYEEGEVMQQHPEIALELLDKFIFHYKKDSSPENDYLYACMMLLDLALVNIRFAYERDESWATKAFDEFQDKLIKHLPDLSVDVIPMFVSLIYGVKLPINEELQEAFGEFILEKAIEDGEDVNTDIGELLLALEDNSDGLSAYDFCELFLEQSQIMPLEAQVGMVEHICCGSELMCDAAVLMILHPNQELRKWILNVFIKNVDLSTISSVSLRRMISMRNWLLEDERSLLDQVIRKVRLAGVECAPWPDTHVMKMYASEFDGSGVQMILVEGKEGNLYNVGAALLKLGYGIREPLCMSNIKKKDADAFIVDIKNSNGHELTFRSVKFDYLNKIIPHFIWVGQQQGRVPEVRLLEIAEYINATQWRDQPINEKHEISELFSDLGEDNCTPENIQKSLSRSAKWIDTKTFTESWFESGEEVHKILITIFNEMNQAEAEEERLPINRVMERVMEPRRQKWGSMFLWMALWAKSSSREKEYLWKDFLILAKKIHDGEPLKDIPLMVEMGEDTWFTQMFMDQESDEE